MYDIQKIGDDIIQTARECGEIIRNAVRTGIHINEKSSARDLVTQYDVKVQEFAVSRLSELYPESVFICEESGVGAGQEYEGLAFVIDPIDGTSNFIHDYHHSCTSIACVINGKPEAAAVYDPYLDEMFSAVRGKGAYLNSERLVIPEHSLSEVLVLFGTSPYNTEYGDDTFTKVRGLFGRCLDLRRSGSAALDLSYVAAGRAGMFFEDSLSTWDYAAGALIVEEAGGQCTDMEGKAPVFDRAVKSSIKAGRKEIIEESGV